MKTYRVMVVKYGYADIKADNETDALDWADNMYDDEFQWTDAGDAEIVEVIKEEK